MPHKTSKRVRKIKKWIARANIGELGTSRLPLTLYNRRALTKAQREMVYVEIEIHY